MRGITYTTASLCLSWTVLAVPTPQDLIPTHYATQKPLDPPAWVQSLGDIVAHPGASVGDLARAQDTICFWTQAGCQGATVCYSLPTNDNHDPKTTQFMIPAADLQKFQTNDNTGSYSGPASWKMSNRDFGKFEDIVFLLYDQHTQGYLAQKQYKNSNPPIAQGTCVTLDSGSAGQFDSIIYSPIPIDWPQS